MKRSHTLFLIVALVIGMIALFGCGKQKYKLNFDVDGFESDKSEYACGDQVTVYFHFVTSDTEDDFHLSDESVALKQSYDDEHGYILTFTMPDHDVTLYKDSQNSMVYMPPINVTFANEVKEADIWILPQTEDNLHTTLWGTATIAKLPANEEREVILQGTGEAENWIINIMAGNRYYSALDIVLEEGYTIIFGPETEACHGMQRKNEFIEILDQSGNAVYKNEDIFIGAFGAE